MSNGCWDTFSKLVRITDKTCSYVISLCCTGYENFVLLLYICFKPSTLFFRKTVAEQTHTYAKEFHGFLTDYYSRCSFLVYNFTNICGICCLHFRKPVPYLSEIPLVTRVDRITVLTLSCSCAALICVKSQSPKPWRRRSCSSSLRWDLPAGKLILHLWLLFPVYFLGKTWSLAHLNRKITVFTGHTFTVRKCVGFSWSRIYFVLFYIPH